MRNVVRFAALLFLYLHAATAFAQAVGRIIAASGDVTVIRANAPRPGPVGTALQVGDLVRTGAQSNAQLWFADASVVAMRHGSEFRIDQFAFRDDPANDRAFYSLVKGGLRTVAGAIGLTDQRGYRLATPHASIGRRGTQFAVVACQNDCAETGGALAANGTYGGIFEGRIGVVNNAGEVQFGVGEFFFVADLNTIPRPLVGPPTFLADRLTGLGRATARASTDPVTVPPASAPVTASAAQVATPAPSPPPPPPPPPPPAPAPVTVFSTPQDVTPSGSPTVISGVGPTTPSTPGTGVSGFVGAWSAGGPGTPFILEPGGGAAFSPPISASVSGSGASQTLVNVSGTSAQNQAGVVHLPGESGNESFFGTVGSLGVDMVGFQSIGNVHWGRWINGALTNSEPGFGTFTETPATGMHYMYGEATSETVIAAKTGSITYSDIGGTTPTDNHGNQATSYSFGPINVNFTTRSGSVSAVSLVGGGSSYSFANLPFQIQLRPGQGAAFATEFPNAGSCSGSCGGQPGSASITYSGIFFGATGNLLGASFHLGNASQIFAAARLFKCPTCP